ncbi:MAG: NUDIX domain-containing protein [Anaerolineales bacterium]|nr:NUDIX domain-containing protein [Anaerolineales bacterium]
MQEEAVDLRHSDNIFAQQPQESVSPKFTSLDHADEKAWPLVEVRDYVNAFVLNEAGEAMVLESFPHGNAWGSWQMIGRYIRDEEDPLAAMQHTLLQRTGYIAEKWVYLGTFVVDDADNLGAGHFFCAQQTRCKVEAPASDLTIRWVPRKQIKRALLDGRIAVINYAIAATLALVMCDEGW